MTGDSPAWLRAHGPDLGLLGVAVAVGASIVTAVPYSGPDGEAYSPLNHTVSELGERGVSELALVFNLGLIAAGALIALYMASIVLRSWDWPGRGFGLIGLGAAVAMAFVGLFPVDDLGPHIVVAGVAFLLIFVAAAWFAVWCLRGSAPYPRAFGWLAVGIALLVVAFLLLPRILQPQYHFEIDFSAELPRPDVVLSSLLEWIVMGSAWTWIALLALYDRGHSHRGAP